MTGKKIACLLHVIWGEHDVLNRCFLPIADWQRVAEDVLDALPCGHYIPEEVPAELLVEMRGFFRESLTNWILVNLNSRPIKKLKAHMSIARAPNMRAGIRSFGRSSRRRRKSYAKLCLTGNRCKTGRSVVSSSWVMPPIQ